MQNSRMRMMLHPGLSGRGATLNGARSLEVLTSTTLGVSLTGAFGSKAFVLVHAALGTCAVLAPYHGVVMLTTCLVSVQ